MQRLTPMQWIKASAMKREFAANLGDSRRTRRAQELGAALAMTPDLSLPKVFKAEAALEAAYRFLRNDAVQWRELMATHAKHTVERAVGFDEVLVAHDTTTLSFKQYWTDHRRKHMSALSSRTQGLFLHTAFAIGGDARPLPLGVVDAQPFVHRSDIDPDDTETLDFWEQEFGLFDNEHERWFRLLGSVEDDFAAQGIDPIHVMDRETDSYGLLSWMAGVDMRFIVRCNGRRRLQGADELEEFGLLSVEVGDRFDLHRGRRKHTHPPRKARAATLTVRAGPVVLSGSRRPSSASWSPGGYEAQPKSVELNLVEVIELKPPKGVKPVRWLLLTREPVDTPDNVLQVVEWYRRRWLIEEYFKALKTGCKLEERQMNSAANMMRIVALLLPAAWRLLMLRHLDDEAPTAHWTLLLTKVEFKLLRGALPEAGLTPRATVTECVAAIAKLGGHLARNGPPGWQTLHAGWRELETMGLGARLVMGGAINP